MLPRRALPLLLLAFLLTLPTRADAPPPPDPSRSNLNGPLYHADANTRGFVPGDTERNVAHLHFSLNIVWTLLCGFLVMFMQAGFALLETGLVRAKNAAHTMSMNFLVYAVGILA